MSNFLSVLKTLAVTLALGEDSCPLTNDEVVSAWNAYCLCVAHKPYTIAPAYRAYNYVLMDARPIVSLSPWELIHKVEHTVCGCTFVEMLDALIDDLIRHNIDPQEAQEMVHVYLTEQEDPIPSLEWDYSYDWDYTHGRA